MIDVEQYLIRKGLEYRNGGDEFQLNCPFCGDTERKFFVNSSTGAWLCHHANKCGRKGSFWQLQQELGDKPESSWKADIKMRPKTYAKPTGELCALDAATITWFAGRGIKVSTLARFGVKQSGGNIAFPYMKDGKVVNVKCRTPEKDFYTVKGAEQVLYARDLIARDADTLLIVEGEPDAMAFWEYGLAAVSVPDGSKGTTWVEGEWEYLSRFKRLYLCLDNDAGGAEGTDALVKRLGWRWDIYRVQLPLKDANDCLMAGVPVEEIAKAIEQATRIKPEEVKQLRDISMEAVAEPEPGRPCEIPGLTEKLGGWRLGELTIHGGYSYSGKSTATCMEAAGALRRFQKVCICNLEMKVTTVIYNLTRQLSMTPTEFWNAFGDDLIFLDVRQTVTVERLMELMAYVAARYAPTMYLIDSLGCLDLGAKEDYYLKQKGATALLARFAKDNEAHVHLVHHFNKQGKEKGTSDGLDLEGSGWIRNLADNILLYRRIEDADRKKSPALEGIDETVRVEKNRAFGVNGEIVLRFDRASKRYEEVTG